MILGRCESSIKILKKMYKVNKNLDSADGLLTPEEEKQLISVYQKDSAQSLNEQAEEESVPTSELLKGKYAKITPIVWYNWLVNTLTFVGVTYMLPMTLAALNGDSSNSGNSEEEEGVTAFSVSSVLYSCISELPTVFIAAIIVDIKGLGRKNSMGISFFVGGLLCLLASFSTGSSVIFWISGTKLFFSLAYTLNYQFTSELYPTKIRGTGLGLASSFGRFGGIIMPPFAAWLGNFGPLVPFSLFGFSALIAGVLTFTLPYDTATLEMDKIDDNEQESCQRG